MHACMRGRTAAPHAAQAACTHACKAGRLLRTPRARTCHAVLNAQAAADGDHHAAPHLVQHHAVGQKALHQVVVVDVQQRCLRDLGGLQGRARARGANADASW
jgi:hypothetical protein